MTNKIGRTRNWNDSVSTTVVALNSTTATKIADTNNSRISFKVNNNDNQLVYIKYQAASVDDDKEGDELPAKSSIKMDVDNIYRGEISAIANSGTPDVTILEY